MERDLRRREVKIRTVPIRCLTIAVYGETGSEWHLELDSGQEQFDLWSKLETTCEAPARYYKGSGKSRFSRDAG